MPLTDTAIRALKPKEGRYKVFDGGGLYLEVLPSGSKVWRIKYRWQGNDIRYTVGGYPSTSLRDARGALAEVKRMLDAGENPARKREAEQSHHENTFEKVAREWVSRQQTWAEVHRGTVLSRLERFVFKHIGNTPVTQITPPEVLRLLRIIEDQGKLDTAERVKGICSQAFRYGVSAGYCESDPCRDLSGALTTHHEIHRAALTKPDDVAMLMARIHEYPGSPVVKCALLWSAYTFCRPGEICNAIYDEVLENKAEWRIPPERMKMRRPHRVPLPRQCLEILSLLGVWKFSDKWLFPSSQKRDQPISNATVLAALQRTLGYGKAITAHGFRAMAKTLLEEELGYDTKLIEIQLAHVGKNEVEAAYNRADYWQQRRAMVQEYADYLDALSAKVLAKTLHGPEPKVHG